jgi:holo-[acyl-carrier protein] synthase
MILGIGVDLVELDRVERLIATKGDRALRRLFTLQEVEYSTRRGEPRRHFAARVAAKEATYKALAGTAAARGIGWQEMEVVVEEDGRPTLRLHGEAARRAGELGATTLWLSLSHSELHAIAVVVVERDGLASAEHRATP